MDFIGIGFGQPWLLWGLAACSIPVLLNLLNRQRFKKIHWAAMKFLNLALEKNQRKLKVENLLLLLVRIMIILFLVFALSQPYWTGNNPITANLSSKSNLVIVLDNSFSMDAYSTNKSYFEKAKELARNLIEKREVGDRVAFMVTNQKTFIKSEPRVIDKQGNAKKNLLSMIKELELSDYPSDYSSLFMPLLNLAAKFEDTPSLGNNQYIKKVYFITDNQRVGWKKKPTPQEIEGLRKQQVVFYVMDVAQDQGNLTVTEFSIKDKNARANLPFQFLMKVKNFGRDDVKDCFATIRVAPAAQASADRKNWAISTVSLALQAGEEKIVPFPPMTLKEPGIYKAEALIQKENARGQDSLPRDNLQPLVFELKSSVKVLLLSGEGGDLMETDFLKLALNPYLLEQKGLPSLYEPVVKTSFPMEGLGEYEVVILANFIHLDSLKALLLEKYLRGGGSLLIFLGNRFSQSVALEKSDLSDLQRKLPPGFLAFRELSDFWKGAFEKNSGTQTVFPAVDLYNLILYKNGEGILPGRISWVNRKVHANLDPKDYNHPLFQFFVQYKDRITSPQFHQYAALSPSPHARAIALFSDEEGTPAIVEKKYSKGRVILLNFSANRDWTNFPISQSYLIFMKNLLQYLVQEKKELRNFTVGDTVNFPEEKDLDLSLFSPQAEEISEPVESRVKGEIFFTSSAVSKTGIYEIHWRSGNKIQSKNYFALKLYPEEGDLDRFTKGEVAKALEGLSSYYSSEKEEEVSLEKASENLIPSNQLWKECLQIAILLLFLEMWLAYWFGSKRR